ncbi:MAG: KilA-N domain-containing protein [Candidatus Bathyarchaeota archaeon]|nr:KilA-N domain-containing protein [Candidatus Bathyarchaeota archaeon]
METEVIMRRELFGGQIAQRSKSKFFSATDLVRAANKWRAINDEAFFDFSAWLKTKSTLKFISELEKEFGEVIIKSRGKGKSTWIHPLLFIDLALAISPKLKIEVYKWLYDHLLEFRNNSGDSYKMMCGALYVRHGNKRTFPDLIKKLARKIQEICGVKDWQAATEEQLEKRNEIHKEITLLAEVLNSPDTAIRIALKRTEKTFVSHTPPNDYSKAYAW